PVQVIARQVGVPWRLHDVSELSHDEQEQKLAAIRAADRLERFDLGEPPLMRFALIRLSATLLVSEILAAYAGRGSAAALPSVTPYRDYLAFIAGQDRAAALDAWREALGGLEEGTRLAPRAPQGE